MTFSTSGGFVDNVIKIVIQFETFPSEEVSVKDLLVHICMSTGMYVTCIKNACVIIMIVKAAFNTGANAIGARLVGRVITPILSEIGWFRLH